MNSYLNTNTENVKEFLPLISIIVLTYNSSKFILETLDSAYRQTYVGPLELIITDDCSTDETLSICRQWLSRHADRFTRVELIEADENKGVTYNVNKGCKAARGEWIKPIAGDDILCDDCIETSYNEVLNRGPECVFLAGAVYTFQDSSQLADVRNLQIDSNANDVEKFDLDYYVKFPRFHVITPTYFLRQSILAKLNYYPQFRRNIEDVPCVANYLKNGYKIDIIHKPLVYYRKHSGSITANINNTEVTLLHWNVYKTFYRPVLSWRDRWDILMKFSWCLLSTKTKDGKPNLLIKLLWRYNKYLTFGYYQDRNQ